MFACLRRRASLALLTMTLSSFGSADVLAQEAAAEAEESAEAFVPEEQSRTAEASRFFEEGIAHFRERRYQQAIRAFQLAAERVPSADLSYNIARAHEELGEYPNAIEYFERYLRDRVDPPDRARVEGRIARLRELAEAQRQEGLDEPTEGRLRLSANVAGAEAFVGGESLGTAPFETPRSLAAGRHELEVRSPGYLPFRAELSVEAGVTTGVFADLQPATHYRAVRGDRIWTWVVGGLGLAGGAAAAGVGIYATTQFDPASEQSRSDTRDLTRISDVALGAGVVLLATAVALYFVEGRAIDTERYTEVEPVEADLSELHEDVDAEESAEPADASGPADTPTP